MKKKLIGLLLVLGIAISTSTAVFASPDDDDYPPIHPFRIIITLENNR